MAGSATITIHHQISLGRTRLVLATITGTYTSTGIPLKAQDFGLGYIDSIFYNPSVVGTYLVGAYAPTDAASGVFLLYNISAGALAELSDTTSLATNQCKLLVFGS